MRSTGRTHYESGLRKPGSGSTPGKRYFLRSLKVSAPANDVPRGDCAGDHYRAGTATTEIRRIKGAINSCANGNPVGRLRLDFCANFAADRSLRAGRPAD